MATFMLVRFSLLAEITDAGALREAALKNFDADESTPPDYPDTAAWHASKEGQQERYQIATEDNTALTALVDPAGVRGLLDGVPGAKIASIVIPAVSELEGITKREALDALGKREGMPWLADLPESAD
jgi:hypothetical protein